MSYQVRQVIGEVTKRPFLEGGDVDDEVFNFTPPMRIWRWRRRILRFGRICIPVGRWQEGRWV